MAILDGTTAVAGTGGMKSRLQFTNKPVRQQQPSGFRVAREGVQKRGNRDRPERKSGGHFLDRLEDDEKPSQGRAGGRGAAKGGRREKKAPKTDAELDAELEAYMNKGKAMEQ